MLKAGRVVLSLWAGLNALVAAFVTLSTVMGRSPPALALVMDDASKVDPRALAVIQAQAAIANPLILAVCALVLVLIWTRPREYGVALAATLVPVQAFAFVSDAFLGHRNVIANVVSTAMVVCGLALLRRGV
jgi:hypothetical protein